MKVFAPILALLLALVTVQASAQVINGVGLTVPVSGTIEPNAKEGQQQKFTGTLTIKDFKKSADNKILMVGVLSGVVNGRTVVTDIMTPMEISNTNSQSGVSVQQATCSILDLKLGRINLDVFGVGIHLSPISIAKIANLVGGGLIGNLLCEIADLIGDSGQLIDEVVDDVIDRLGKLLKNLG